MDLQQYLAGLEVMGISWDVGSPECGIFPFLIVAEEEENYLI
jgi:hypothetical protein